MKVGFVGPGRKAGTLARQPMLEHRGVPMPLASAVREGPQTAINELGPDTGLNDLTRVSERQARVDIVRA